MQVRIKYCTPCGYRRHAERLSKKIAERWGKPAELIPGERFQFGILKIWVDDRLVFDKSTTRGILGKLGFGRIPPDPELLTLIDSARK